MSLAAYVGWKPRKPSGKTVQEYGNLEDLEREFAGMGGVIE